MKDNHRTNKETKRERERRGRGWIKNICWNWKDRKTENVSVPIHTDKQTDRQTDKEEEFRTIGHGN